MALAMVLVLGPEPQVHVLTLLFISTRFGNTPEMPLLRMRKTRPEPEMGLFKVT